MQEDRRIKAEIARLKKIFVDIPEDKRKLLEGLFVQTARLRIRLDGLWKDIRLNGETERFTQGETTTPHERERPTARLFNSTNKNYQSCVKMLIEALPDTTVPDAVAQLQAFTNK